MNPSPTHSHLYVRSNTQSTSFPIPQDRFEQIARAYVRQAPVSLCLRELNRLIAIEMVDSQDGETPRTPVLDVGCGDGHWWTHRDNSARKVYGIDISTSEVLQAKKRITAEVVDISKDVPFSEVRFKEIIGNCSLEHVRDIDAALGNLLKAAAPGARLVLFVPTPQWAFQGYTLTFLLKHFPRLAMTFSGALNGFFQHWHLYEMPVWQAILKNNGWKVTEVHGVGNSRAEFLFRLFLPVSFIGYLPKVFFGKYPNRILKLFPDFCLIPALKILKWALATPLVEATSSKAYEYMIIAEAPQNQ
jgi:ubiquinone/menaquinone biosynthesis C-methylase UbiE